MTCLWAGSANPRVLSGRHEPDCPGDCRGCQPAVCEIMSEAAGCVNTERPLTHSSDHDHVYDWGCRHKSCVNPDHLEAVTQAENNRRARAVRKVSVA